MTKPRTTGRTYRGQKGDERCVVVTDVRTVKGAVALAFGRRPGYRTLRRGKPAPISREIVGFRRGMLITDVLVSREAALALHEALDEYLFGEGSE